MFAVGFRPHDPDPPFGPPSFGQATAWGNGTASLTLEVEPEHPDHVYMGHLHLANGLRYFVEKSKGTVVKETDGYQCNTHAPLSEKNQERLERKTLFLGVGEGSLWLGDFSGFQEGNPSKQKAIWTQMLGPPIYWGN